MFIDAIQAIILGIIEGITEFLPISSTGHLIIANQWIHFGEPFTAMFDIVIQLGAILAVVVFFWNRLLPFKKEESARNEIFGTWKKVIVGVIPALFAGFLLGGIIEEKLFNPMVVAVSLIVGGIILIWVDRTPLRSYFAKASQDTQGFAGQEINSVGSISLITAFWIGCIQILALVPGVSRAGATIVGGLLFGASRKTAVEFSFFLAIPTMIAATAYSFLKHWGNVSTHEYILLAIGFVVAFLVALLVIRFLLRFIERHTFIPFGWYRIVLGILIFIFLFFIK